MYKYSNHQKKLFWCDFKKQLNQSFFKWKDRVTYETLKEGCLRGKHITTADTQRICYIGMDQTGTYWSYVIIDVDQKWFLMPYEYWYLTNKIQFCPFLTDEGILAQRSDTISSPKLKERIRGRVEFELKQSKFKGCVLTRMLRSFSRRELEHRVSQERL